MRWFQVDISRFNIRAIQPFLTSDYRALGIHCGDEYIILEILGLLLISKREVLYSSGLRIQNARFWGLREGDPVELPLLSHRQSALEGMSLRVVNPTHRTMEGVSIRSSSPDTHEFVSTLSTTATRYFVSSYPRRDYFVSSS